MRLEALRGQVVVLVFWASWCEPCREELPLVADLAARWSGEGLPVRVLAVSADEDQAGWRRGLERFGALGMDLAWSAELAAALGVRALPAARVLDREGRVAGSLQGYDPGQASRLDTLVREQLEP
jgi:thiol-disulfide isomerase/thioredoxin